jgi:acetylornithine/N-succinyldiaminopimelate aminotransferase
VTDWQSRYAAAILPTYGRPQRVLARGRGCYLWDVEGRRYLDLLGGIATSSLGHAHPDLLDAVSTQLATLGHVSNFFASEPQIRLAERLLGLLAAPPGSRVYLASSGAEANEAAFKLARRTGRPRILALEGAFHGRTMGALALTHKPAYREPFEPLPGGVEHLPFGDLGALAAAMDDRVAALVVEPIQGEAGVRPLPDGYLAAARELTRQSGALLVLDEVQTGVGRTGAWFGHTRHGVVPDVVTLAKGLGGGVPIGATVALGEHPAGLLTGGQHGSTFGGNPVAAAAALAVLEVIDRDGLLESVRAVGAQIAARAVDAGAPLVVGVRGEGLMLGLALSRPLAAEVVARALDVGFVVNAVTPDTVRLVPPLVLTAEQADDFLAALPGIISDVLADADPTGPDPTGTDPAGTEPAGTAQPTATDNPEET